MALFGLGVYKSNSKKELRQEKRFAVEKAKFEKEQAALADTINRLRQKSEGKSKFMNRITGRKRKIDTYDMVQAERARMLKARQGISAL